MRIYAAGTKASRGNIGPFGFIGSMLNRIQIARKDREDLRELVRLGNAGPTVRDRQQELRTFYERYEEFVEVVCDSAQYGPNPKLEGVYGGARNWMIEQYPALQPYIRAFLRSAQDDMDLHKRDAFEILMGPETLSEFLKSDDGGMISRITRTREALNLYAEHLRQLADKTG